MKYLELFLSVWGFFLISETTSISFNEQTRPSDTKSRDFSLAGSDFKCPFVFGTFPDPTDCSHYYICIGNVPFRKKCGLFQNFDVLRRTCMPVIVAICGHDKDRTTRTTSTAPVTGTTTAITSDGGSFKCPSIMGSFPHPNDCSKYYSCFLYKHTLKICPQKELFDAVKTKCKPEKDVHCGNRQRPGFTTTAIPTETTTTEISTESTISSTRLSSEEIITDTSIITTTEITTSIRPTGPPKHNCDEDDVDCIITETGDVEDWFICPQDVGSYPHPSSDKLFIFCMNWVPSVKKCGLDLVFSKELSTCTEPI